MEGFEQALREWERDNIYFHFDRFDYSYRDKYNEEEDPEVDRRLEDE